MKSSEEYGSEEDSKVSSITNKILNPYEKSKKFYTQKFRPRWLKLFHPWLSQDDSNKPFCNVCKCQLHCNICHFKRHARTVKHKAHMEAAFHGGDVMDLKHKFTKTIRALKREGRTSNNKIKEEVEELSLKRVTEQRVNSSNQYDLQSANDEYEYENKSDYERTFKKPLNKSIKSNEDEKLKFPIAKNRAMLLNRIKRDRMELFDSYAAVISQRNSPVRERDHVDLYFDSVSASIKRLSPKLIAEAKIRVSQMVGELELREITAKESASGVETSIESPFSMSTVAPYYINQPAVVYVESHHQDDAINESTSDLHVSSQS